MSLYYYSEGTQAKDTKFVYNDVKNITKESVELHNSYTSSSSSRGINAGTTIGYGHKLQTTGNGGSISVSRSNWNELTTYFKYDTKIRKLIYTTNPIESLNRQLRKYTKIKSLYPTDEVLMKSVYLSLKEATKKWTGRISGWGEIYSQLSIYFEGRI